MDLGSRPRHVAYRSIRHPGDVLDLEVRAAVERWYRMRPRAHLFTALALLAFAANSVLSRVALEGNTIDAPSFTSIRLASGALALLIIARISGNRGGPSLSGDRVSSVMLFLYAASFSFAYVSLSTATGALILFGSVQATMLAAALGSGERPHPVEWAGLIISLGGLVYLVLPGLDAPEPIAAALMTIAGISWGIYSLMGRHTADPLASTTRNFVRALPLTGGLTLLTLSEAQISGTGVLLALASGALASGVGYVVWYRALGGLSATRASLVQLAVPVLAACGGVVFLGEAISLRLTVSTLVVLGGVALAILARGRVLGDDPSD